MGTPTRRRRILGAIGYVVFLLVCAEVVLQIFYRVTAGSFLSSRAAVAMWAPNEWSGVFNKPNLAYHHLTNEFEAMNYTNAQGFRVPEGRGDYPLEPPPDTTRLMLLGPSFAFGWGVDYEDSFAHRLERRLEAGGFGGSPHVQLINAGVNSLGAAFHLNWFRHVGREFRPSLVMQFVYGSMAVNNDTESKHVATPEGYLVRRHTTLGDRLRAQAKRSALVFYGWIVYSQIDQALSGEAAGEVIGAGRELKAPKDFRLDDPDVVEALGFYRAFRDEMRSAGADALVVYFPLAYAVHPEDTSRWRHLGVRDIEGEREFNRAFCEHLTAQESLPCVDITEALQRAARETHERLYYWLDVHWTPAGNAVVADTVAPYLLGRDRAQHATAPAP